jgi:hypothetical protein
MNTAAQVSIGGRRQMLEDGNDLCNSESDSENEDHGEDLIVCPMLKLGLLPFLIVRVSSLLQLMGSFRETSLQELPL